MKHNQFKHIVNKLIKENCTNYNLTMSGVDITNNEKVIYIYDGKWNCVLTIGLWLDDKRIHISGSTNRGKVVSISNRPFDIVCGYIEFHKVYECLNCMFQSLGLPVSRENKEEK